MDGHGYRPALDSPPLDLNNPPTGGSGLLPQRADAAEVSPDAEIGPGTRIWHQAQVREGARIGRDCIIGKGAYVDVGVHIGDRCKIQNYACLYRGAMLYDGVFVGPGAILCNDKYPRAVNAGLTLKSLQDWTPRGVIVGYGASIGAGAIVLPGLSIGEWAMVGAGAVVTGDVGPYELVVGNPARIRAYVCPCGEVVRRVAPDPASHVYRLSLFCGKCGHAWMVEVDP